MKVLVKGLKKMLVLSPILLLMAMMMESRYGWRLQENGFHTRMAMDIAFNSLPFLFFILLDTWRREQESWVQMVIQASFYVYAGAVLYLTLFPLPITDLLQAIRNFAAYDWVGDMSLKLKAGTGFNLEPFKMFVIYDLLDKQIVGNFIMLTPLGIYLPLLYQRFRIFYKFFLIVLLTALSIEGLQFIFAFFIPIEAISSSYIGYIARSADIDDVILNTVGACVGYMMYKVVVFLLKRVGVQKGHNNVSL